MAVFRCSMERARLMPAGKTGVLNRQREMIFANATALPRREENYFALTAFRQLKDQRN
jgi:hypothetical protein